MKPAFIIAILLIISLQLFSQQTSIKSGQKVYEQNCLSCHQADGAGVPHVNPPLIRTSYITGDKTKLITWVLQGSIEKVPVDGKTYSNNMPAQDNLNDKQIADVLTYILNSFGNNAGSVTAAEVKVVRASIKKK